MLRKLYRLASIVCQLTRYRFYASSLLLIYDGDRETQEAYASSLHDHPGRPDYSRATSATWNDVASLAVPGAEDKQHRSHSADPSQKKPARKRQAGQITIRLIDFAHCTTGDDFRPVGALPDDSDPRPQATYPPTHSDLPDTGFLLGVQSLCAALETIWDGERKRRAEHPEEDSEPLGPLEEVSDKEEFWRSIFPDNLVEEATRGGFVGAHAFE